MRGISGNSSSTSTPRRVLVLQHERCVADPGSALCATYRFLGLDESHPPPAALLRRQSPTGPEPIFDRDTTRRLVDLYATDVADLARLLPDLDVSWWPHFADRGITSDGR